VVPVQDGVEAEEEGAVRLPAPERADAEHHDVAVADGCIDDLRAIGEGLSTGKGAGEQHLCGVGREAEDRARTRVTLRRARRRVATRGGSSTACGGGTRTTLARCRSTTSGGTGAGAGCRSLGLRGRAFDRVPVPLRDGDAR